MQKRVKNRNKRVKIVPIFKFDENGYAEIDESKFTETDLKFLKTKFKVVEEETEKKIDITKLGWHKLRAYAKEKGVENINDKNKEELLKELEKK